MRNSAILPLCAFRNNLRRVYQFCILFPIILLSALSGFGQTPTSVATISATAPTTCGGSNGTIVFSVTPTGSYTVNYSGAATGSHTFSTATYSLTGLPAGLYSLSVVGTHTVTVLASVPTFSGTPVATLSAISTQTVCNAAPTTSVTFTSSIAGSTFAWRNSDAAIGLAATGSGSVIPSFTATNAGTTPIIGVVSVTPTSSGCAGSVKTFTITVKPTPTVTAVASQSVCNTTATTLVTFVSSISGSSFSWHNDNTAIGLVASGTSSTIASFTAINTGTVNAVAIITVTATDNGCTGPERIFSVTVKPTPTVAAVASQTVCNASPTAAITFVSSVSGATFAWHNSNTAIGLAAAGATSSIGSFTASNTGTTVIDGVVSVTPTAAGCVGSEKIFTITVDPSPTVTAVASQSVCNTSPTTLVTFASSLTGSTFNWHNNNTTIGLVASGTSSTIASFSGINTSVVDAIAIITVTATDRGCAGPERTFSITVKPTPTLTAVASQSVCNASLSASVTFTSSVSGSTFVWHNSNTGIGLGATGSTAYIDAFTATNTGSVPIYGIISVTPTANGCTGAEKVFTVTVKPTPTLTAIASQSVCNTAHTTAINFLSSVAGSTFAWLNDNNTIGLAASGSGSTIATFTALNTGSAIAQGIVSVVPTAAGCDGAEKTFTITVYPTPTLTAIASQSVCNTSLSTEIDFFSSVDPTNFAWHNSNTTIGLGASGTGSVIPSFTGHNTGTTSIFGVVTVSPTAYGCSGAAGVFTISVLPTPTLTAIASQTVCNTAATMPIDLMSSVDGTVFNWSNDNTAIGLAATGSGSVIASFVAGNTTTAPIVGDITISPAADGCVGTSVGLSITVDPSPTVTAVDNQIVCNNTLADSVDFTASVIGAVYEWDNSNPTIGLAASGAGNIDTFTAINLGTDTAIAVVSVSATALTCVGPVTTFSISVKPSPVMSVSLAGQSVCSGTTSSAILFASSLAATTYTWSNDNTTVGLVASGTDSVGAFAVVDTSNGFIDTAMVVIVPFANGCYGANDTAWIYADPIPVMTQTGNDTFCNAQLTPAIMFNCSALAGANYNWMNSDSAIGFASSGSGNINPFIAVDSALLPVSATVTVTPVALGCAGTALTFTVVVDPIPTVSVVTAQTNCNNTATTVVNFTSSLPGSSFAWTNPDAAIGLPATGIDSIPSFTVSNDTNIILIDSITVIATSPAGCAGPGMIFEYIVYPTATVMPTTSTTVCNGDTLHSVVIGTSVLGTTFTWTNSDTLVGLIDSGSSNIPSFLAVDTGYSIDTAMIIVTPMANGCPGKVDTFDILVFPTPTDTLAFGNRWFCNREVTPVIPLSGGVSGTFFTWINSDTLFGLAASGRDSIQSFTAKNRGVSLDTSVITITATANGCINQQTFDIFIAPTPTVNKVYNKSFCGNTETTPVVFAGDVAGTDFVWTNSNTLIGLDSITGMGPVPAFEAIDSTLFIDSTIVVVTPEVYGCAGANDTFKIYVRPLPILTSATYDSVCAGSVFTYTATCGLTSVFYDWKRSETNHITPDSNASDYARIEETLHDDTLAPVYVNYIYTVTSSGCQNVEELTVKVSPIPTRALISVHPASDLCSNTLYQNFGASYPPDTGVAYNWSVTNGQVWASGYKHQNALISFPYQGASTVYLTMNVVGGSCFINDSEQLNIGSGVSEPAVVTYSEGYLLCLDNTADSFKWGYDDSLMLDSTIVPGQTNQSYYIPTLDPSVYYWVMTWHSECMEKTYYTTPTVVPNTVIVSDKLIVYPNPVTDELSILVSASNDVYKEVRIYNTLGQVVKQTDLLDNKAVVNMADLPPGMYMVSCYGTGNINKSSLIIKK